MEVLGVTREVIFRLRGEILSGELVFSRIFTQAEESQLVFDWLDGFATALRRGGLPGHEGRANVFPVGVESHGPDLGRDST